MYDSDLLIENVVEEIADEVYEKSEVEFSELAIASSFELREKIMDRIQENDVDSLSLSEFQIEEEQVKTISETVKAIGERRFIVKYKNSDSNPISEYLGKNDIQNFTVDSTFALTNCEVLEFDSSVNPRELAEILDAKSFADEIEYIQPDFQMGLSSEGTFYLEAENGSNIADDFDAHSEKIEDGNTTNVNTSDSKVESDTESAVETENTELEVILPVEPLEPVIPIEPIVPIEPIIPADPILPIDPAEQNVIIAMIDTGVDVTHSALEDRLWENDDGDIGWNFCDDNAIVFDEDNPTLSAHGTHVAGIIAEHTDAQIMVLKAFGKNGAYTSHIIDAIHFAEENGASIINCSFGGSEYNLALKEAIAESDLLFVTAAGNAGANLDDEPVYPACFELNNILCVASANADGGLSFYSNYSDSIVDLAAYGREIESCLPENGYGIMSGSSMAAALVSGVAGSIKEESFLSTDQLKERLIGTADCFSNLRNTIVDGRILNEENALEDVRDDRIIQNKPEEDVNVSWEPMPATEQFQLYSVTGKNIQIEATDEAVIVLKDDGTVWAWGENTAGVCGRIDGAYTTLNQITGLTRITKIAAGDDFCLALRADGTVWAWGNNKFGALGTGASNKVRPTPAQVVGLAEIVDIGVGSHHSFAVNNAGRLYAWGANACGQLGDDTTENYDLPERLLLRNVVMATGGEEHSIAVCADGTVWTWGENSDGQLGTADTASSLEPIESEMTDAVYVAAGDYHSLAIDTSGAVYSWGLNDYGQLGNDDDVTEESPVLTELNKDASMIAAGGESSIAIASDGTVWSWGEGSYGKLGLGSVDDAYIPGQISGLTNCIDVDMSTSFGVALQNDGTVWVWGRDNTNAFGTDNYPAYVEPVRISALEEYESLFAGKDQTMGITEDNDAYGWGDNDDWVLGDTSDEIATTPVLIDLSGIESVDFGNDHVLAQKTNGRVYAWGQNSRGQLGDDSEDDSAEPVRSSGLTDAIQVAAGYRFSLALESNGDVYAWGYNKYGQVANGDTDDVYEPEWVSSLSDIEMIAAGRRHGLALDDTGRVWAWGENDEGQLGDGSTDESLEAIRISYPRYVVQIDAGDYYSVALDEDGYVWTWGENSGYQLGNGTTTNLEEAEELEGIEDVVEIAAGSDYCLALAEQHDGVLTAYYARGLNLFASFIGEDQNYYLYNGHGDVVQLTDTSGAVIKTYEYDAFGNEADPGATDANPFRYCGEYQNLFSGLIYLRNRYYDPSIGRFITEDPARDGLNWYVYANNNPIKYIDPSGLRSKEAADKIIKDNATYIISAAEEFGVNPGILAATIYAEQRLNVDWKDDYIDGIVGFYGVDTSIGIGQLRISTAKFIEKEGYMPTLSAKDGGWNIPFIGFVHGTEQMVREKTLENSELNIKYAAGYLKCFHDEWKNVYPDIDVK